MNTTEREITLRTVAQNTGRTYEEVASIVEECEKVGLQVTPKRTHADVQLPVVPNSFSVLEGDK